MKTSRLLLALALTLSCSPLVAETVKDREGAVRQDKAALEKDVRWIYNDFQRGLAEAQLKGKPLLVVLRCVPCLSCAGLDASVLQEPALAPLLEQFVCVRVINANALDLSLFQFDYDLSFSTLFFNGDGTVYGRFGSWTHQKNPQDKATTGYQRALEAALAVHRGYPANKPALAGKQGGPTPFKTAVEIPALAAKYKLTLDWDGKVVPSCVHCHQIGDAMRASYRTQKKPMPVELIFPMPMPETIGLTLAADHVARVTAVAAGSIAAKGGLQSDDELISLAGQPLISVADVSWVLHRAPASGSLSAVVKRAGREAARWGSWYIAVVALAHSKPQDLASCRARPPHGLTAVGSVCPLARQSIAGRKEGDVALAQRRAGIRSHGPAPEKVQKGCSYAKSATLSEP